MKYFIEFLGSFFTLFLCCWASCLGFVAQHMHVLGILEKSCLCFVTRQNFRLIGLNRVQTRSEKKHQECNTQ